MPLFVRIAALEPARDLLGRPFPAQFARYCSAQDRMASQLAGLGPQRTVPCGLIRHGASILFPTAIATDLPADRRRRPAKLDRNRPERATRDETSGYLLALDQAERAGRPLALRRTDPTRWRQHRKNRRGLAIKSATD